MDSENHPATLTFTPEAANSSLLSAVSRRVIDNLAKEPIAFHNHGFGECGLPSLHGCKPASLSLKRSGPDNVGHNKLIPRIPSPWYARLTDSAWHYCDGPNKTLDTTKVPGAPPTSPSTYTFHCSRFDNSTITVGVPALTFGLDRGSA